MAVRTFFPQGRAVLQVIFDGFGDDARDSKKQIIPVVPRAFTVHKNKYNQADSFDMTFDANDVAVIDPALMRGCQVEIYLFSGDSLDQTPRLNNRQLGDIGSAVNQREDVAGVSEQAAYRDLFIPATVEPLIVGLVDDVDETLAADGKWITLTGQDYTDFLTKKQWPPLANGRARRVPLGKRLDVVLRDILRMADPTGNLSLKVEGIKESDLPITGKEEIAAKRGIAIEQNTNYFDVLYGLAIRYGFILFVDGLSVVLSEARHLHSAADPNIITLTWGLNIEQMSLSRHLGREAAPGVVVQGWDPKRKRAILAEWPPGTRVKSKEKAKNSAAEAADKSREKKRLEAKQDYTIVPLRGVVSETEALRAAQSYFTAIGRAERKAVVRTRDLRDSYDRPLLDLRVGRPLRIIFDEFNEELMQSETLTDEQKIDRLVARGFGFAIAAIVVSHWRKLQSFRRPMRTREITFTYDIDQGVSLEIELCDYIVVDGIRGGGAETRAEKADRTLLNKDNTAVGALS